MRRILLIDTHLPRALQLPAHHGVRQQLLLKCDAKLKWQVDVENGDVERGRVIDRIDVRFRSVNLLQASYLHRRKDRPHNQPRPRS